MRIIHIITWKDFSCLSGVWLLNSTLDFASHYDSITDDEQQIILHVKKSLLYDSGE